MSKIQKTRLENGIHVITEEVHDFQSASIGIWVNIGSRDEMENENGVSHFIEHLLFKGTEKRSARDIAREIESVGGILNAFTGREYTCFYAKVLGDDIPLAIDLLSDIFLNSRFAQKEVEKERLVVLQEIKMIEDTPDDLVHDIFAANFWKGHSIGMPVIGSADIIKSIKRDAILRYFRNAYLPHTVIITAAGNLKHSKLVRLLRRSFEEMECRPFNRKIKQAKPAPFLVLERKKLEQVHICLGVPSPSQSEPARYKAYLLNTILGGGMSSRLFHEIREKRGLAYSVYSYLNLYLDAGALVVYAGVSKDNTKRTIDLILKEVGKLRREPVSQDELNIAKEQLKGGMLLGLETTENRMTKLARDEIYFKRTVPIREIIREIEKVTQDDLMELASDMFANGSIGMVAMGDVSRKNIPGTFNVPC
ncbi:MAG: zinc protease [Deltaproteobacteria bacterium GWC2_42_11]|nr:MAG: zinc protease [Deltaproteobacteria bacterium GWC2_42_11]HBO84731.1 peptidase M16 [Deltaproteobacteria bacterium]